jgi:hypothetical protein
MIKSLGSYIVQELKIHIEGQRHDTCNLMPVDGLHCFHLRFVAGTHVSLNGICVGFGRQQFMGTVVRRGVVRLRLPSPVLGRLRDSLCGTIKKLYSAF